MSLPHIIFMQNFIDFCFIFYRFGNTAYLYISVAFIQMLKALSEFTAHLPYIVVMIWYWFELIRIAVPVATFIMAVLCGTDKLRRDLFLNMVLVSVGVVVSSYGEIHFNVIGTLYQVTGIVAEALRLVLTQVLLQKKGLTLNPITSLYYIAPCRYRILYLKIWILACLLYSLLQNPCTEICELSFLSNRILGKMTTAIFLNSLKWY